MMTVRRAQERHHDRTSKQEIWRTFDREDRSDLLADGFGALEILNEDRLGPGTGILREAQHDAEIITYVREGALAHEDSTGRSGVIQTGEFRRLTAGRGIRHSETNASLREWAHVFQIWLRPGEAGLEPGDEQRRFSTAQRRGLFCIIASQDGQRGSLRIRQDALIYSALLEPGQHVIHELTAGRTAWLHIVQGAASIGDHVLTTGDSIGVTADRAVSLTAREATELLLLDLGPHASPPDAEVT